MIDKSDALYPKSLILSAIAHNKIGKSDGNKIMEQATNYDTTKKIALENLELLKLEEDCELSIPSFVKDNTGILTKEGNEQIISDLQELVTQYYQTHEYSKDDFFVCTDMALDLWNQCKAKNIKAYIVIGSLDKRYPNENEFNHAWVVTEPVPEKFVAMDATAGIINLENERYYFGYYFENPKNLKNYQDFSKDYENQVLIVDNIVSRYNGQYSKYVNALNQLNYDANHYNKKYAGKILNAFDYENSVDLLTNIEVGRVKVDAMASELNSLLNQVDNEKNTLNELFLKIYNLPTFIKAAKKEFQTCPPAILD